MNTYLFSIHKRWNDLIFIEKIKKLEIRKTSPKPPFKAIVYEPFNGGGSGKVIGEFICNEVDTIINLGNAFEIKDKDKAYTNTVARNSCLDFYDLQKYLKNKNGCAIHITDLKLYDKPRELGELKSKHFLYKYTHDCYDLLPLTRPPQSWQYIETPDWEEEK